MPDIQSFPLYYQCGLKPPLNKAISNTFTTNTMKNTKVLTVSLEHASYT